MKNLPLFGSQVDIKATYQDEADLILYHGDVSDFLATLPDETVTLIVTSPPYNLGKAYENRMAIEEYLEQQASTIAELYRVLKPKGSLCWQVGNFVENTEWPGTSFPSP